VRPGSQSHSRTAAKWLVTALILCGWAAVTLAAPLSRAEQKDRIAKLDETYREFIVDVTPILTDAERDAFLRLENDPQRDVFIEDFWRRRDKKQGTTNNAFRKLYYERLEYVKEHFEHTGSDRARIYLLWGEPAEVTKIDCPRRMRPIEIWYYPILSEFPEFGREPYLLFYLPEMKAKEYILWHPLTDGIEELMRHDKVYDAPGPPMELMVDCRDIDVLAKALKTMRRISDRSYMLTTPPPVDPEAVSRIIRSVVIANPSAPKIEPRVRLSYPSSDGAHTDVQLFVEIPRAQMQPGELAQVKLYSVDVTGEITREGRMWETFRYRFDFPFEGAGETLPVMIDRMLRPGPYAARIKIADAKSGAEAIIEQQLDVPETPHPLFEHPLPAARGEGSGVRGATIRIVPLPDDDMVSGVQKIETILTGSAAKGVEFWLDGHKVAARHAPPYVLDVDFGDVPRLHRVRVVAVDEHDLPLTGDEITVNTGTEPFRVRIASPRVAPHLAGPTRVAVDVKTPRGKSLRSVDLYFNDQRVVTMVNPPFVQTIDVPSAGRIGYIRAVATLSDDSSAEDAVIINSPAQMEQVDVHLVELPTTVVASGRPRLGLPQAAFRVFDESKRVDIAKFEEVKNLPLSIGIAVDNSASMEPRMAAAEKAAAEFLRAVLRGSDKAFVVAFDSTPRVMQSWSSQPAELFAALAKMQARDQTALYDAIVYSLYNFTGVRGQRALVVVTDGKDTSSKFTYEQALEYAHRSGVPVYAIGIGIRALDAETKLNLSRLCAETGGSAFFVGETTDLAATYAQIADELRSQYIIGFYPPEKGTSRWHEVSVQVDGGKAKTVRGYYP
jgi:Ca-activated chloride channel homolog